MKNQVFKKYLSTISGKNFVIEQDMPEVGWYLYVYENGNCIADHLQNDYETIIDVAKENYGIPKNKWTEITADMNTLYILFDKLQNQDIYIEFFDGNASWFNVLDTSHAKLNDTIIARRIESPEKSASLDSHETQFDLKDISKIANLDKKIVYESSRS